MKPIRFGIFNIKGDYEKVLDFNFFESIGCTFQYFNGDDYIDQIRRCVRKREIDILLLTRYNHRPSEFSIPMNEMVNDIQNYIPVLIVDVYFPNVTLKDEYTGNTFILKDSSMGGVSPNIIEVPLLGVVNFDMLHIHKHNGNPYAKQFVIKEYDEFYNRTYDIMCKLGKAKPIKLLTTLLAVKNNLNNSYINISFSKENSIKNIDDIDNILNNNINADIINKFDLKEESERVLIGSYLGSLYSKGKLNCTSGYKDYNVDFNSYSEIYVETLTCELNNIQNSPELLAFTEKTFNNFFDFKIPLAVDTPAQINFLKQIGFEFPIPPCYLEVSDTLETIYDKIDKWMAGLNHFDFKTIWEDMIYDKDSNSPLHKNHKLIYELLSNNNNLQYWYSKPMYQSTYKVIEKIFPNLLETYRNWDYQTYLWFKNKNLLN
jgi:hypothetical protein